MKKIILLLLLVLVSVTASARKSYITVYASYDKGKAYEGGNSDYYIYLTGDVPDNIEGFFHHNELHCWISMPLSSTSRIYSTGEILNLLSEYGYEVEIMNDIHTFLLSKEIPSGSQTEIVGDLNSDSEVNVADVNKLVNIILGLAKSNPSIMKQLKEQLK